MERKGEGFMDGLSVRWGFLSRKVMLSPDAKSNVTMLGSKTPTLGSRWTT